MNRFFVGTAIAAIISMPVYAQTEEAPQTSVVETPSVEASVVPEPAEVKPLILNAGSPIKLAITKEVNSSTHEAGDIFALTVLEDVQVGDTVIIPRGTPASGEITWRTGKGAFGKSGKLEFSLRSIDLDGRAIPVKGDFRQEGEGNTIATGVGIIAIGVFAGFITGKRARLPMGRELMSQMVQNVEFTGDGKLSPSFDSEAAITAATADTPLTKCKAEAATITKPKKKAKALKKCYRKRME